MPVLGLGLAEEQSFGRDGVGRPCDGTQVCHALPVWTNADLTGVLAPGVTGTVERLEVQIDDSGHGPIFGLLHLLV